MKHTFSLGCRNSLVAYTPTSYLQVDIAAGGLHSTALTIEGEVFPVS